MTRGGEGRQPGRGHVGRRGYWLLRKGERAERMGFVSSISTAVGSGLGVSHNKSLILEKA